MTNQTLEPPQTTQSVTLAKRDQMAEQAAYLAQERLRMLSPSGDPRDCSEAVCEAVRDAALRFVAETEQIGPAMFQRHRAEKAGGADLKMRVSTDLVNGLDTGEILTRMPVHFRRSLAAYERRLTILLPWRRGLTP